MVFMKLPQSTIKYLIEAEFSCEGIVEKPDVIGALFGQTEGLLGSDLDLRELQRTGRIGRIEVEINSENAKTKGKIIIPSSLTSSETALIAASIESVERIGPCEAKVKVTGIKDVRVEKRQFVLNRAKDLLANFINEELPSTSSLTEKVEESARLLQLKDFEGLPAGPCVPDHDEIIVVEGRADVINLLKNGIKNVIAINGVEIPDAIINLSKQKLTTLFVDGDRAGELIIKKFLQVAEADFIARAPQGKEVEELTKKEIYKCLRERIPVNEYKLQ
jgi:DNA primase